MHVTSHPRRSFGGVIHECGVASSSLAIHGSTSTRAHALNITARLAKPDSCLRLHISSYNPMASQNQDRLRTQFSSLPPTSNSHATGWDSLWAEGTFIPWDRGHANPALIDLLRNPSSPPNSQQANPTPGAPVSTSANTEVRLPPAIKKDGKRARALVPGCGKGYDVALLASWGYEAWGLEVSVHAARAAGAYLEEPGKGPLEGEYSVRDEGVGRGSARCVVGDYFDEGWVRDIMGERGEGVFDVIYDNTVGALPAALPPPFFSFVCWS